jgi:hypothetical protein
MELWERRRLKTSAGYFFADRLLKYIVRHGGSTACFDLFDDDASVRSLFLNNAAWLTKHPDLEFSIDMFLRRFREAFCSLSDDVKEKIRFEARDGPYGPLPSGVNDILNE